MGKLAEIREKLVEGATPKELIAGGYAKASVYYELRRLRRSAQLKLPDIGGDDELADLKHRRELAKVLADIQEIESKRERLPARIEALEGRLASLETRLASLETRLATLGELVLGNLAGLAKQWLVGIGTDEDEAARDAAEYRRQLESDLRG